MQSDQPDPAGGADKNRMFDGVVTLPAGNYVLRYRSDGSHSYDDWNADPPDDPESWGISVFRMARRQRSFRAGGLMKIAGCIKPVPDSETRVKIPADGNTLDDAGL